MAAGARANAAKYSAWYRNSPPTPCAHTTAGCRNSPIRPSTANSASPNAPDTPSANAVSSSGGTADAARDSRARKAHSPIAPAPATVALNTYVARR